MLNVLLAEDHQIVRNGVRMLLETDGNINIIAEAENGLQALECIGNTPVDVVLADINMPEMDGIMLLKKITESHTDIKVVILSMHDNEKYVAQAFAEGADGYLLKNVSADELIFSIKHVHAGGKYLCSEMAFKMLHKTFKGLETPGVGRSELEFSEREVEVLQLIAEGLTNSEMSDKLFLSKRTIEGHRQSLIDKTGSRNTAALIRFAVVNNLIN